MLPLAALAALAAPAALLLHERAEDRADRVDLRGVRLDRAGDVQQRLPAVLLPGGIVTVSLTDEPPCTARLRTYLDESSSFSLSATEVSRRGRAVVVDALLRNDSVLPLRLVRDGGAVEVPESLWLGEGLDGEPPAH